MAVSRRRSRTHPDGPPDAAPRRPGRDPEDPRPEKKGARVPILFLTAREGSQNKLSSIISGGDDFVTKPVTFQELAGRVEEALRRAKIRQKKTTSP